MHAPRPAADRARLLPNAPSPSHSPVNKAKVWNNKCVTACPADATRNTATGACVCNDSSKELFSIVSEELSSNVCITKCGTGQTRDAFATCACSGTNQEFVNGACVTK